MRSTTKGYREAIVAYLLCRDGSKCSLCDERLDESVSIDHIIQAHDGGPDTLENFRLVHLSCNQRRPRAQAWLEKRSSVVAAAWKTRRAKYGPLGRKSRATWKWKHPMSAEQRQRISQARRGDTR